MSSAPKRPMEYGTASQARSVMPRMEMPDEEEADEEEEDDEDRPIFVRSTTLNKNGGKYTFEASIFRNYEDELSAWGVVTTVYFQKDASASERGDEVGNLNGNLLRCNSQIHEVADGISGEAQELACMFCDRGGAISRIEIELPCKFGNLFHIANVAISAEEHKDAGDLDLHLIHQTLAFLENLKETSANQLQQNLATEQCEDRTKFYRKLQGYMPPERWGWNIAVTIPYEAQRRQFVRMGFQQAGRNADQFHAYYMTCSEYVAQQESKPESKWKTDDEVRQIDLYVPPPRQTPTGVDKELHDLVGQSPSSTVYQDIERLVVGLHASIHTSRALFVAAANSESTENLLYLIRLGGDVNAPDEHGNRPLHVAAATKRLSSILCLLGAGANTSLTNEKGHTPLDSLKSSTENTSDFLNVFGLSPKAADILDRHDCIFALLPATDRSVLIDGWLSPRMLYMLSTTAEFESEMSDSEGLFEKYKPMPISQALDFIGGIPRAQYFPPALLLSNPNGLYKSFFDGWKVIWDAMFALLKQNQAPTLERIHQEILTKLSFQRDSDNLKYQHYLAKGGKVEYAINAMVQISKNVLVNGDDGWEYSLFEKDIEALPSTPLDDDFDIVRVKLLGLGREDSLPPSGPYNHQSSAFDDSEGEEGDY